MVGNKTQSNKNKNNKSKNNNNNSSSSNNIHGSPRSTKRSTNPAQGTAARECTQWPCKLHWVTATAALKCIQRRMTTHMTDSWLATTQYRIMHNMRSCSVGSMEHILPVPQHLCFLRYPCSARVALIKHSTLTNWCKEQVQKDVCAAKSCLEKKQNPVQAARTCFSSTCNEKSQDHIKCPFQCADSQLLYSSATLHLVIYFSGWTKVRILDLFPAKLS